MVGPINLKDLVTPWRRLLGEREFVVLLLSQLVLGMAYSFVVPFYSMYGTIEVGMSNWALGVFMTITSLAGIVISTALARWSDTRFSRRSILLLGCLCGTLGYAGYAWIRNVAWLTVVRSLALGVASITFAQLFSAAREALGRHGIPAAEAPLYMNIFRLLFSLAWTIGPAVSAWVMVHAAYEGIFLVCALLCTAAFLLHWLAREKHGHDPAAAPA